MFHLFHLGPLPLSRGRAWLVGGIDEFGGFMEPVMDRSLETAVKLMVEGLGADDVTLEPALAAFAPRLGVPVGPLPDSLGDAPAVLAFSCVNAQENLPMGTGIRIFLDACRDYGSVAPWERYSANQPFLVRILAKNKTTTREALVAGGGGEPSGLVLFDRPGDARRGFAALRAGDTRSIQNLDAITLAFRPEPEWALRAVRTAFSLPEVPYVFRTRRGQLRSATEVELGALTAALTAVALLAAEPEPREGPAESVLCIDGHEYRAIASPPEPRSPPDALALPTGATGGQSTARGRGSRLVRPPRPEDLN
jgi:hypothetical protein